MEISNSPGAHRIGSANHLFLILDVSRMPFAKVVILTVSLRECLKTAQKSSFVIPTKAGTRVSKRFSSPVVAGVTLLTSFEIVSYKL